MRLNIFWIIALCQNIMWAGIAAQSFQWKEPVWNQNSPLSTRFDLYAGSGAQDLGSGDGPDDDFDREPIGFGRNADELGSGAFITDDEDLIAGSGDLELPTEDEDYFKITTPSTTTTFTSTTTTTTTTTSTTITSTTSTTTIPTTTTAPITTTSTTTTSTTARAPTTTTFRPISVGYEIETGSGAGEWDEDEPRVTQYEDDLPRSSWPTSTTTRQDEYEEESEDFVFETPSITSTTTTPRPTQSSTIPKSETTPLGPTPESGFLLKNHILLVSLYVVLVILLVIAILVGFCTINRCRSYDIIENTSDASSDLIIKKRGGNQSSLSSDDSERGNDSFFFSKRSLKKANQSPANANWI